MPYCDDKFENKEIVNIFINENYKIEIDTNFGLFVYKIKNKKNEKLFFS